MHAKVLPYIEYTVPSLVLIARRFHFRVWIDSHRHIYTKSAVTALTTENAPRVKLGITSKEVK